MSVHPRRRLEMAAFMPQRGPVSTMQAPPQVTQKARSAMAADIHRKPLPK
jgi:hypothetical protein